MTLRGLYVLLTTFPTLNVSWTLDYGFKKVFLFCKTEVFNHLLLISYVECGKARARYKIMADSAGSPSHLLLPSPLRINHQHQLFFIRKYFDSFFNKMFIFHGRNTNFRKNLNNYFHFGRSD